MYWQAITVLEARQMLLDFDVSAFPHLTRDAASEMHRTLHALAYPDRYETHRSLTEEEMQRLLAGV